MQVCIVPATCLRPHKHFADAYKLQCLPRLSQSCQDMTLCSLLARVGPTRASALLILVACHAEREGL